MKDLNLKTQKDKKNAPPKKIQKQYNQGHEDAREDSYIMVVCLVYIRTTGNLCGGRKAALGLRHMPKRHVINRQPVVCNANLPQDKRSALKNNRK